MRGNRWPLCLWVVLPLVVSGCGWWRGENGESFEDELPDLNAAVEAESADGADSGPAAEDTPNNEDTAQAEPSERAGQRKSPSADGGGSSAAGSHMPLRKTVVQTLAQGDAETRTRLQLEMAVSLEERTEQRRRFGVQYKRVRYSGEIDGERFEYDSEADDGSTVAPRARVYRGLAGNGFYFWLGPQRRIRLVGFRQFLERCVSRLPPSERRRVQQRLSVASDADAVFRFVDDSVGLLASRPEDASPADPEVGTSWTVLREMRRSVPMTLLTEYTIESLSADEARIQIRGTIGPASGGAAGSTPSGLAVQVRGGRSIGHCTIDRQTGLPKESHLERLIDMEVRGQGGSPFHQQKRVLTTIEPIRSGATLSDAQTEDESPSGVPKASSAN